MMADPTPAQELREASRLMREQHGPSHVRHAFWSAVADWLESSVELATSIGASGAAAQHPDYCHYERKVARAYLGTAETEPAARTGMADD